MSLQDTFDRSAPYLRRFCGRCGINPPYAPKKLLCASCKMLCPRCAHPKEPGKGLCNGCFAKSMRGIRSEQVDVLAELRALRMRTAQQQTMIDKLRADIEMIQKDLILKLSEVAGRA